MSMPPFNVPRTITDEQVAELAKKFLPIKLKGTEAFLLEHNADLFDQSYIWCAEEKPYTGALYVLDRLWTVHSFSYQGFFKPSIAEVIQQIPRCYDNLEVLYFEIIAPEDASDLNLWIEHIHAGVHVAKTNLYVAEPSSRLMAQYWFENKGMLDLYGSNNVTPAQFAIDWIGRLRAEQRLEVLDAMKAYDPKTGDPKTP